MIYFSHAGENIPDDARDRFVKVIEQELLGLHEGNIARYKLSPNEYNNWRKIQE